MSEDVSSKEDVQSTNDLQNIKISAKQRRIGKAKIKGKKNTEIGAIEYPDANAVSQRQLVSRELKKEHVAKYVEQGKLQVLKEFNVTWRSIAKPRVEALQATKTDHYTGAELIDHNTRMKAADALERMLESKNLTDEDRESINKFAAAADEMEILTILRKT